MIPGVGVSSRDRASRLSLKTPAVAATADNGVDSPRRTGSPIPTEFYLSDTTLKELQLVQDHYDNYVMQQELAHALRTPGPQGVVGSLSLAGMEVEELAATAIKAERTRPKTLEAKHLLECVRVVRDIRVKLMVSNWAGVADVLARVVSMDNESDAAQRRTGVPGTAIRVLSQPGVVVW